MLDQAVACIQALCTGSLPPTVNLDYPDPDCVLDQARSEARQARPQIAISNSFGFDGHNVTLVSGHATRGAQTAQL
jgi:3-oxoacyl-[acyl-carrier-protein] synthase II